MRFRTVEDKYDFLNFLSASIAGLLCTTGLTLLFAFGLIPLTFALPALILSGGITFISGISSVDKSIRLTTSKGRVTWAEKLEQHHYYYEYDQDEKTQSI